MLAFAVDAERIQQIWKWWEGPSEIMFAEGTVDFHAVPFQASMGWITRMEARSWSCLLGAHFGDESGNLR